MLEAYLEVLEEGYYEVKFAFDGLSDEKVWKRPAEGLLSVGELAGHIAYWHAARFAGAGGETFKPDLLTCKVKSPLIDEHFAYYTTNIASPVPERFLSLTAEQVCKELIRVHEESLAHFKELNPDLSSTPPGFHPNFTYRALVKYASFHIAYHTGQMYSARHLLGDETPDN